MKIRDVMTVDCQRLNEEEAVQRAAEIMANGEFGSLPVANSEKLVGMLTDRDIVVRGVAAGKDMSKAKVGELMSGKVYYCFEDAECDAVADNMGKLQVRRMPVVDKDKRLVGIVSLGDLSTRGAKQSAGDALCDISAD